MKVYTVRTRFFCTPLKRYIPVGAVIYRYENVAKLAILDAPDSGQDVFNKVVSDAEYDDPAQVTWFWTVEADTLRFTYGGDLDEDVAGGAIASIGVTGPQGSQGVAGATGATGPQGVTGTVSPHLMGSADHTADTLANLNTKVSDAVVNDLVSNIKSYPRRISGWTARNNHTSLLHAIGAWNAVTETDTTSAKGVDSGGLYLEQQSAATTNSDAITSPNSTYIRTDAEFATCFLAAFTTITTARLVVGYTDQVATNMSGADDPASAHGFWFQKRTGDTNWFICTKNGTTLTRADTGVAVSTDPRRFILSSDGSGTTLLWRIQSATGTSLANGTLTSTLPGSTVSLRSFSGLKTLENVQKDVRQYWAIEASA